DLQAQLPVADARGVHRRRHWGGGGQSAPAEAPRLSRVTLRAHLAVVAAAILFGTTFFVVKDAVADVQPMPFIAVRFLIAAVVLTPFAARSGRHQTGIWKAGAMCGLALGIGYIFQTVGLQYTTSSVSAFITYLLVVIVPVLSALVLRRLPSGATITGVVIATVGLFLLTGGGLSGIHKGELLTLGCAFAFAVHIVLL